MRRLKRVGLLDGETLYEMWAEAIPRPKDWEELHALERAPWTELARKLVEMADAQNDSEPASMTPTGSE